MRIERGLIGRPRVEPVARIRDRSDQREKDPGKKLAPSSPAVEDVLVTKDMLLEQYPVGFIFDFTGDNGEVISGEVIGTIELPYSSYGSTGGPQDSVETQPLLAVRLQDGTNREVYLDEKLEVVAVN